MGSGVAKRYPDGMDVMIDVQRTGSFSGPLLFGTISAACAALQKNNFEYTVEVEDNTAECVIEQYVRPLEVPEIPWVHDGMREVAVWVETHGESKFVAELVRRDEDNLFEVRFVHDQTVLEGVSPEHLSEPDHHSHHDQSPESAAPSPLWLLDRKIQSNIDVYWPMRLRIKDAIAQLQTSRGGATPPLCGPFVGKTLADSESFPAHPAPLPELRIDGFFVDTWAKYAGKIKFATTYKMGPAHPRFDAWVDWVDASDPLYFHAALPVYAGLVCLGSFQGQPEWVRAGDVALVGIALYVDGELFQGFPDPPLELTGMQKHGHECCNFIPGCASTYVADCTWVGAVFCLAPADKDMEVRDDIYNIMAYHQILKEIPKRYREKGIQKDSVTIEVNLILSTNYLANHRAVCSASICVQLSDRALAMSSLRLRDVQENKLSSLAASNPKRQRKNLSEHTHEHHLDSTIQSAATGTQGSKGASFGFRSTVAGGGLASTQAQRRTLGMSTQVSGKSSPAPSRKSRSPKSTAPSETQSVADGPETPRAARPSGAVTPRASKALGQGTRGPPTS